MGREQGKKQGNVRTLVDNLQKSKNRKKSTCISNMDMLPDFRRFFAQSVYTSGHFL